MANEYLRRTPTSTGNRRVWTFSCWIKSNQNGNQYIFGAFPSGASSGNQFDIALSNANNFAEVFQNTSSVTEVNAVGTAKHRDNSAWTNIVVSVNTALVNSADRIKYYVNGALDQLSGTFPSQNFQFNANNVIEHWIGNWPGLTTDVNSQITDVFLIDGQALTPDVFGFYKQGKGYISAGSTQATDFRPGQWVPKTPRVIKTEINRRGGFGVNGFYLPMNDSRNFGADFHGDPNSIITLNEKLPQPRVGVASTAAVGLGYTDALRADPYAANLVLALPFVSSGLCTNGTNVGVNTGFGDYSHIIRGSGAAKVATLFGNVAIANTASYYGSSAFFDGTGDYLEGPTNNSDFQPGSGDYTVECWVNPTSLSNGGGFAGIFNYSGVNRRSWLLYHGSSSDVNFIVSSDGTSTNQVIASSPANILTTNQWAHIVGEKQGNIIRVYVNGVVVGINTLAPTSIYTNTIDPLKVGTWDGGSANDPFTGYLQDLRIYKGVAKYKGGFDVPRPYTPVGIATWRQVPDTTANNFATLNPLIPFPDTLTNGNLTVAGGAGKFSQGTIGISSSVGGKWYFEFNVSDLSGRAGSVGWAATSYNITVGGYFSYRNSGVYYPPGTAYGDSWTTGDTVGIALDADNGRIFASKNGVWQNSGDPAAGTNPMASNIFSGLTNSVLVPLVEGYGSGGPAGSFNFGQNPTFSGNTTAGTFTDSNGKGLFKYEPPSGFLALCEDNLPTPAIKNPGEYFKTVLYNNATTVTGIGFTPDLIWHKSRTQTYSHYLYDSVRGVGAKGLNSNTTSVEGANDALGILSFDKDGFSFSSDAGLSQTNAVAWCWRAGAGTTSTNTDGSITSVVSVNQDAGFSIVSWTGTGTSGATVGHGLGKKPAFIIQKARDDGTYGWNSWHKSLGNDYYISLNSTGAQDNSVNIWPTAGITDSVFQTATSAIKYNNLSGVRHIAYCWAEIEGFSKFGSYVGNGNADGSFVYCGFKPAVVITKSIASGGWNIMDSSRGPTNLNNPLLQANTAATEVSTAEVDFLSNGFKFRGASTNVLFDHNASTVTYIFAAFAESPFTTANAK